MMHNSVRDPAALEHDLALAIRGREHAEGQRDSALAALNQAQSELRSMRAAIDRLIGVATAAAQRCTERGPES